MMGSPAEQSGPEQGPTDSPAPTDRGVTYKAVASPVAISIGRVVTQYSKLERSMNSVFRVIFGIKSGELAAETETTIRAPTLSWKMARQVFAGELGRLESGRERMIEEFDEITRLRNDCIHGLWWSDDEGRSWCSPAEPAASSFRNPEPVDGEGLERLLARIEDLHQQIHRIGQSESA